MRSSLLDRSGYGRPPTYVWLPTPAVQLIDEDRRRRGTDITVSRVDAMDHPALGVDPCGRHGPREAWNIGKPGRRVNLFEWNGHSTTPRFDERFFPRPALKEYPIALNFVGSRNGLPLDRCEVSRYQPFHIRDGSDLLHVHPELSHAGDSVQRQIGGVSHVEEQTRLFVL